MITPTEIVAQLTRFSAETTFEDLPQGTVNRARNSILDVFACGLLGSGIATTLPFSRYIMAQSGSAEAQVWGSDGGNTSAFYAAMLNALMVHATEMSETYIRAVVHPGNVIIPALVAVAEREHSTGKAMLLATAIGYEALIRFGFSVGRPFMMEQGFHSFSVMGTFGSTVATAKLMGFDAAAIDNALGIAACQTATPLIVAAPEGATVKELFEGYASALGVMSSDLSRSGVIGVKAWAENWYKAVPRQHDMSRLAEGLGELWYTERPGLRIKMRPVMGMVQPTVGALVELLASRRIAPADIASIRVETTERAFIAENQAPDTTTAAKASIPFMTAAALVHQDRLAADPYLIRFVTPELMRDEAVRALAAKVTVGIDATMEHNFEHADVMKYESRVRITLNSGEEVVAYKDVWPETSAMTYDQVADKFRACVAAAIPTEIAEAIVETVRHLETLDDMRTLTALLTRTGAAR